MKTRYLYIALIMLVISFAPTVQGQTVRVATDSAAIEDSNEIHSLPPENFSPAELRALNPAAESFASESYPEVSEEIRAVLSTVNWESNADYKGFGSPSAKKGGTLKYAETSYPPSLRTVGKNANSTFNSMLTSLCYESLLDLDPVTFDYVPHLARRWAIAEDKVTFFFEIDEKARWSDGNPVVAEDVVRSWELYTDAGIEDPFSIDYWNKYEKPVAISKSMVMIKSKQLNWRAFMSIGFMTILPGHIIEKIDGKQYLTEYQNKLMPGSGPYAFESSKVNEEIILNRRSDWWQQDAVKSTGYYNFDRLHFTFIQDDNLVKLRFKKGEIDWIAINVAREWNQEFIPAMLAELAYGYIQKRKVYTHRPIGTSGVAFNMRKAPFNDIRVRQAFAHLYNREKMMDKLFFNEYEYLDSFYPNSPYENPENPKTRYDPDKAVELLEAAGWLQKNRDSSGWLIKDGKRFELSINYVQKSSERILTIFQEDLRDIGIKLNLKQVTWATDIKEVGERTFELSSRAYGGLLFPNPESSLHSKFADLKNNNNIWGFKNARVDEICEQYPLMFDPKERVKAVREIDRIVTREHLYALGWFSASTRILYWNKFGMPDYVLAKTSDQRSIASLWWFDDEKERKLQEARKNKKRLDPGPMEIRWWDENYPPSAGDK